MSAHRIFPTTRRKRLVALQFFEPSDRRGIKNNFCTLDGVHPCRLRIPLVIADQRRDDRFPRVHLHVPEIAGGEVILLEIIRIVRDVHLPVFAGKPPVGIVNQ